MEERRVLQNDVEKIVEDIIKLCSINSVEGEGKEGMPFGEGPAKALQCALKLGEDMGFISENFDNYAGHIDFGEGEETLGILCHADVVPCGEDWICDPYNPQIIDGRLYGRGVLDNKGPMVVCLHAMRILKEMNIPLKKKVRLIIGTNEETNWKCMEYYFGEKKVETPQIAFTPDADFPLKYAEKGLLQYSLKMKISEEISLQGGNAVNSVPERASVCLDAKYLPEIERQKEQWKEKSGCAYEISGKGDKITLTVFGKAAHGAWVENGINAITGVMLAVDELKVRGDLERIASLYMKYIGLCLHGENLGLRFSDEESGILSFNVGTVGVSDGEVRFAVDNRVPVTYKCGEVMAQLEKALEGSGIEAEILDRIEGIHIDKDSFLVQTLMQVYRDVTGDMKAEPEVDGGCTYARTMQNCVAFGALLPDQENVMHEKNEYLEISKIETWLRIYLEAIYRLAK